MHKAAGVRRSACDQCRAKRVRCLRAENSTVPCARCSHIGVRCVTGAAGNPGRPRNKPRLVDGDGTPRGPAPSPADVSSPGRHRTPTLRDMNHAELHAPQSISWEASCASSIFVPFGSPSIEENLVPGDDILAQVHQLSSPPQLQGQQSTDDELNAMLHIGRDPSTAALGMDIDPLLDLWEGVLPQSPQPQCFSAATLLMQFREEMDQRIAAVDAQYADPLKVLQGCKQEGAAEVENPAALLLTRSKEFVDIIQSLTLAARPTHSKDSYPSSQLVPPNSAPAMHIQTEDALSTEIVLLALSSYLALMRLYDALFHCIYQCLCQMPPDASKSVKVKSVLRIGGISSLQDMPLKNYAIGILDAVQTQVRTLERCMGIPTEYCLSGEVATSYTAAPPGIFSRADRARLFRAAMAQEDVKSRRGSKSYVESIRASIQDSVVFLD